MTTLTLKTNANNDLFLPDGRNLSIISGQEALVQDIRLAHLMRTGEDIYDTSNGVDYMGTVFSSPPDVDAARQSIANAILKKGDVSGIQSLTVTVANNTLNFEAEIVTIYGDVIKTGS